MIGFIRNSIALCLFITGVAFQIIAALIATDDILEDEIAELHGDQE